MPNEIYKLMSHQIFRCEELQWETGVGKGGFTQKGEMHDTMRWHCGSQEIPVPDAVHPHELLLFANVPALALGTCSSVLMAIVLHRLDVKRRAGAACP